MKKITLLAVLVLTLFLTGCFREAIIETPEADIERQNYCTEQCGGLYTHDPCANDCMAGKEVEKRNFGDMNQEVINATCEEMCGSDPYRVGTSCVDSCIKRNSNY